MNIKIVYTWIFLISIGYLATNFINNLYILGGLWVGILILGCTIMIKYGWQQNKYLTTYWCTSLTIGVLLSGIQFYTLDTSSALLPINHINTIWMIIFGINFVITTLISKIIYFAPLGVSLLAIALPLDSINFSYPALIYGLLFTIILIGYIILSRVTPQDPLVLGDDYNESNGISDEHLSHLYKFKCSNCGYIYEGYTKIDYCPRCMAGSDLLVDVG